MIDAKRRHDYAHLINDSGHHLLSVVNGILDMSKIESGNFEITPEPFAPRQVIDECCELLGYKAREIGIDLVVDLPERPAGHRSPTSVRCTRSCSIWFPTRSSSPSGAARSRSARAPMRPTSRSMVEDTGVGIGADDLPRIGDPFFQARSSYDRRHDGTGLGLSIVKGLLGLHGGQIEIASRLGEGTRVTIRLPLDCEAARKRGETCRSSRPSTDARRRSARQPREDQCVAKVAWSVRRPPSPLTGRACCRRSAGALATPWASSSRSPPPS